MIGGKEEAMKLKQKHINKLDEVLQLLVKTWSSG
jgi:hypothetical protein